MRVTAYEKKDLFSLPLIKKLRRHAVFWVHGLILVRLPDCSGLGLPERYN